MGRAAAVLHASAVCIEDDAAMGVQHEPAVAVTVVVEA